MIAQLVMEDGVDVVFIFKKNIENNFIHLKLIFFVSHISD